MVCDSGGGIEKKKGMDRITEMGTQIGEAFKTCHIIHQVSQRNFSVK